MPARLEGALARHRNIAVAALVVLTLLAWVWLIAGAGMAMDPLVSLAPLSPGDVSAMGMGHAPAWTLPYFILVLSMWWVMMVAMMLPAAAPTILLYARAAAGERPATASFLAGYLLTWGGFSVAAALLQHQLERIDLLAPMLMTSQSRWLSAAILVAAGIYQSSPLKDTCLRHCRSPAHFLSLHYRPGPAGALRMGVLHGAYCVGCCWLLMMLLFVGGVMNLAWIALLTLMVAAEKLLPFGRALSFAMGAACVVWGVAVLVG